MTIANLVLPTGLLSWHQPGSAVTAALFLFCAWRVWVTLRAWSGNGRGRSRELFQTRRSMRLREAAEAEAAALHAREAARCPSRTSVVYLSREWERLWWSDKLGVSVDAIRAAMKQVGPMVEDVERYLAGNRATAAA